MAEQKVTHKITAEYQGLLEGSRKVQAELKQMERANAAVAKSAKAAAKEVIEAEKAKERAASGFVRMREQAQDRMWERERAVARQSQRVAEENMLKTQKQGGAFGMLTGKVNEFKSALIGMVAGYATFDGLIRLAEAYYGKLERIAGKQAEMGKGLRELAMKIPGGPEDISKGLKESAEQARRLGIKPEEMASTRAWAKDVAPGRGPLAGLDSYALAEQQTKLEKLGYDRESTRTALQNFRRQGVGTQRAGQLIVGATQAGALSQGDLPKISSALEQFGSQEEGLAVASALKRTGKVSDRELASMTSGLGEVFKTSKIGKSLRAKYTAAGIDYDATPIEGKIQDLADIYGTDERKLQRRGLSADQAHAIALLGPQAIQRERAAIGGVPRDIISRQLETLKKTPELEPMYGAETQAAKASHAAMYGPLSARARAADRARADAGAFFMESKSPVAPWLYNEDTGQANAAGMAVYATGRGAARAGYETMQTPETQGLYPFRLARDIYQESVGNTPLGPSSESGKAEQAATEKNTVATEKLTSAIDALTRTTGGDVAAPSRRDRNAGL